MFWRGQVNGFACMIIVATIVLSLTLISVIGGSAEIGPKPSLDDISSDVSNDVKPESTVEQYFEPHSKVLVAHNEIDTEQKNSKLDTDEQNSDDEPDYYESQRQLEMAPSAMHLMPFGYGQYVEQQQQNQYAMLPLVMMRFLHQQQQQQQQLFQQQLMMLAQQQQQLSQQKQQQDYQLETMLMSSLAIPLQAQYYGDRPAYAMITPNGDYLENNISDNNSEAAATATTADDDHDDDEEGKSNASNSESEANSAEA